MTSVINPTFTEAKFSDAESWQKTNALPANLQVERAQTQVDVNKTVLNYLAQKFLQNASLKTLDLPSGDMEFAGYVKAIFPNAEVTAVDIMPKLPKQGINFLQMDISRPLTIPEGEQFDLVTSVSGIMMFSNTKLFIENVISRLKKGGTFVVTNDNSATLKDKLTYLLYGSTRMFPPVFNDKEWVTENVPVQELVRLLRTNGMVIKDIVYTSDNSKDFFIKPLAAFVYAIQKNYLKKFKNDLPEALIKKMYPYKHLFARHYIIITEKM